VPFTVVVTRDVEDRYRGFLGSLMLELSPGVYAQARLSAGVRGRILSVLSEWHGQLRRGSIVVCWPEPAGQGGLGLRTFGEPPKDVVGYDGMLLLRRALRVISDQLGSSGH
jgi:CRISPR-associated protein Cas2